MQTLELLSPAKNLECGIAAIDHGADAVYIGAESGGARAAAGNSVSDIAELCRYAHQFGARVYVTVNTIVYEDELAATRELLRRLADAGVDAILAQDMALLQMPRYGMELHASTQTDNRTAEKAAWLALNGFSRVVLARELSLDDIRRIHQAVPSVQLECFVHGALCVSYSGLCYASQYCFKRSANRGECAQFCRLKFDLVDADGKAIERGKHLLSLKDMSRMKWIEQLADAGVTSFKIEGRLKDVAYVKNITAAYSEELDKLVARHPDRYSRASLGRCSYTFKPDINRTFNRGYTDYFMHEAGSRIWSPGTPKAIGQSVGTVKDVGAGHITVAGTAVFANGDGLCFFNGKELCGFRVNRAEGNKIYPLSIPQGLRKGMELFRNHDKAFETLLAKPSARRKIAVSISIEETAGGLKAVFTAEDGTRVEVEELIDAQQAEKPQKEYMRRQMERLGNTPFECTAFSTVPEEPRRFVPASILAGIRRQAADKLQKAIIVKDRSYKPQNNTAELEKIARNEYPAATQYNYNIANSEARQLYRNEGIAVDTPAFELQKPQRPQIMQCQHCLRRALGHCLRHGGTPPQWREPLRLRMDDGRTFSMEFDCKQCQMNIYAD